MPTHASRSPAAAPSPRLAGRERARAALSAALAAARCGHGSLVLIVGEAGVGKTALAEALAAEAAAQGTLVLAGGCHDLSETPPYGPWAELLSSAPEGPGSPPPPDLQAPARPASQTALFAQLRDYLAALARQRPLLLHLEDLHWADPASLELLRAVARSLSSMPLLLLASYRPAEIGHDHPLYALVPALVREASPLRLHLGPLDDVEMRTLVAARYPLPADDAGRLASWLQVRAEGNPFYAGELLRGLEDEGVLRPLGAGWTLGDPARAPLPPLLRHVIDHRVTRLDAEAQRVLAVAAVTGLTELILWADVSGITEAAAQAVLTVAEEAQLLTVSGDGQTVRFAHDLIREALYTGMPAAQRRALHRRAGEALATQPCPDPDAVAYHLQRAGDPRAVAWLLRAAERAERAYAWGSAAARCASALALLERQGAAAAERGWLAYRIASLRRYRDPHGSLTALEQSGLLAEDAQDRALAACVLFLRGNLHCYVGEFAPGLAALQAGVAALDTLDAEGRERLRARGSCAGFAPEVRQQRATLVMRLAGTGRFIDACRLASEFLASTAGWQPADGAGDAADANASRGLAIAHASLGRPEEAGREFARARAIFQHIGDSFHVGVAAVQELQWLAMSYRADRPNEWRHLAAAGERAWARAGDALADLPSEFARLPLLVLTGDWARARELALTVYASGGSYAATAARALGLLAREQGDRVLGRRLLQEQVPAGPNTLIGTANFSTTLVMQRLAAALALEEGNLSEAREWLRAYDGWLAWSGALLGRADGELDWAAYHRAAGDAGEACRRAEQALAAASEPRQPLALLVAHRLLGELCLAQGQCAQASANLQQALALADSCAAPYERALTLLALAELRLHASERAAAHALLDEAVSILTPLAAAPALARAAALSAHCNRKRTAGNEAPAGLSLRELEILGRLAAGQSNREIAAALVLSVRTVEKHAAHIYTKIGARGRAGAAAYAVRHGLLPESTRP